MAVTNIGNSPYGTAVPLAFTSGSPLAGVGSPGFAVSTAFAPPVDSSGVYYDIADIRINMGSDVTLTATTPFIQVKCQPQLDGANFGYVGDSNGVLLPANNSVFSQYPTNAASQYFDIVGVPLYPGTNDIDVVILNNTGVTFPSTASATLYPRMSAAD